jgi:hypothetical protein
MPCPSATSFGTTSLQSPSLQARLRLDCAHAWQGHASTLTLVPAAASFSGGACAENRSNQYTEYAQNLVVDASWGDANGIEQSFLRIQNWDDVLGW